MFSSPSIGRLAATAGLVLAAYGLARLGRWLLDDLSADMPQWAGAIERFGSWALGMMIGLVVVVPLFRLYGVWGRKPSNDQSG